MAISERRSMDNDAVLGQLSTARAQLLAAIEGLSEADMTTLPALGAWTLRDVLAHISGWAAWDLQTIEALRQGEHPDLTAIRDVDVFNSRLVTERADWSVARILDEMEETHVALQALVRSLPVEDLFRGGPFRGPYWDSLAGWLRVAWEHEEEHTQQIRAWRDKLGLAGSGSEQGGT
jgi:hypothetical protein